MTTVAFDGHGRQTGALRPDWGDNWAELTCDQCGAGWVGPIDEPCSYCWLTLERMRAWQAEIVLTAPDVDINDRRYADTVTAWGQRLHRAVDAQLITRAQARRTYEREVKRAARAS